MEGAVLEVIRGRRSVRRYLDKQVDEGLIRQVLEAANCAPSAHNKQSWRFLVVGGQAKEDLARLVAGETGRFPRRIRVLMRLASQIIRSAPVAVAIFKTGELAREMGEEGGPEITDFFHLMEVQSASAAVENLMLAASSLGLGSVWLGVVCLLKSQIAGAVGEEGELMAVVPIGYPAPPGGPAPRKKPLDEVTVLKLG